MQLDSVSTPPEALANNTSDTTGIADLRGLPSAFRVVSLEAGDQKQVQPTPETQKTEKQEITETPAAPDAAAAAAKGDKLKSEIDELLDEIDDVLEDNAEEFVRSYVQKGGQ